MQYGTLTCNTMYIVLHVTNFSPINPSTIILFFMYDKSMILSSCKKFFFYFNQNKKSFISYSAFSFLVGILELAGVALTYPFVIKLLENKPTDIWHSPLLIGTLIVGLFLAKNTLMIFYTYLQSKFTKEVEKEANITFIKYFLSSPYQVSAKISLAKKVNILGYLIPNTINNFILRLLNLNVNFFIFSLISLLLIIKFPIAMLITLGFATILIYIQNSYFKPKLSKIAQKASEASAAYNQKSNDVLLSIKNVKISNNEKYFFENYLSAITQFYRICIETSFLNSIPPYVTEPFIILLLFILLAVISYQNYTEPDKLIASFAIIVSAIFRLAPTISRIQVNLNGINSAMPIVNELLTICRDLDIKNTKEPKNPEFADFNTSLELKNISFEYEKNKPILKNINLTIHKGEFIGIAGLSGAGKTTLVDIIAGLLTPNSGEIFIDGNIQKNPLKIGYIPQEVSLINASIKENVAYGCSEIQDERVIDALKKAQLHDFIIENYKDGINANPFVDSSGFSQGQKQRLAIARAMYSNPDILILDEATSSLDLKTENEICSVLMSLKGSKTIIAIAHRLSTIKNADRIAFMKNSEIVDISEFNELINKNADFRELARLASVKEL